MFTRKLFSVIDNIIVDVSEIICCSEPTDSFTVNVIVAELPGHKALQPGHVPRLPPPGASTVLAVPNVTAHPSSTSVSITVLLYNCPLLCGFNVPVKGLINLQIRWINEKIRQLRKMYPKQAVKFGSAVAACLQLFGHTLSADQSPSDERPSRAAQSVALSWSNTWCYDVEVQSLYLRSINVCGL